MLRFRSILIVAALTAFAPLFVNAQTSGAEASAAAATTTVTRSTERVTAVPFRAGTILSAEISKMKPAFDVESVFDQPLVENPAWVELIVKIDNGRSISRFDYELVGRNGTYSCFAVAEGADGYSVDPEKWTVKSPHPLKYYRLLFPVRQDEIAAAKKELLPVTLKVKLYDTSLAPASFQVRVMPEGRSFTRVSSVRPEGICNMTYHEAFESN
ncbi:MAG: hypothetical protein IKQ16_04450 [Lentisphaeria bacterium]|jgi:hypothetical protein|nr:hypothetical protein [Lentisphaeria bacterium]